MTLHSFPAQLHTLQCVCFRGVCMVCSGVVTYVFAHMLVFVCVYMCVCTRVRANACMFVHAPCVMANLSQRVYLCMYEQVNECRCVSRESCDLRVIKSSPQHVLAPWCGEQTGGDWGHMREDTPI